MRRKNTKYSYLIAIVLPSVISLSACTSSSEDLTNAENAQDSRPTFRAPPSPQLSYVYEAAGRMLFAYAKDLAQKVTAKNGPPGLSNYINKTLPGGMIREFGPLLDEVWKAERWYLPQEVTSFSEAEIIDYYQTLGDLAAESQGGTYQDGEERGPLPKLAWTLNGTTRCLDDRWEIISSDLQGVFQSVRDVDGQPINEAEVRQIVESPAGTSWPEITSAKQLIGAILWQTYRNQGNSGKLFINDAVAAWLYNLDRGYKHQFRESLGCGAAFGAQFRAALVPGYSQKQRTFFDPGVPFEGDEGRNGFTSLQVRAFGPWVSFIDDKMNDADIQNLDGLPQRSSDPLKQWPVNDLATKINYALMLRPGSKFSVGGLDIEVPAGQNPRTNISTSSGNSAPQLQQVLRTNRSGVFERLSKNLSAFVVVGIHYLTARGEPQLTKYVKNMIDDVQRMKAWNPFLKVQNEYVGPKSPGQVFESPTADAREYDFNDFPDLRSPSVDPQRADATVDEANRLEGLMFNSFQRGPGVPVFDSIDLNIVELWPLVRNMVPRVSTALAAKLPQGWNVKPTSKPEKEDLQRHFPLATWLMEVLRLERLSIHATNYDLVLHAHKNRGSHPSAKGCDTASKDEELVQQAVMTRTGLLRSTQTAASKLYNPSGELKEAGDIHPFYWYSPAANIAEVLNFWKSYLPEGVDTMAVAKDAYYIDAKQGITVLVVPTPYYYIIDGGVTSVGDVRGLTSFYYDILGHTELQEKLRASGFIE